MVLGTGTEIKSFSMVEGEDTWRRQTPELITTTGIKRGEAVALRAGKVPLAAPEVPGSTERKEPLPSLRTTATKSTASTWRFQEAFVGRGR